jgi:ribonuclease HI
LAKKAKYYVVWRGRQPGVYLTWDDCQAQVHGFEGARFKSFDRLADAEAAFLESFAQHLQIKSSPSGGKKSPTPQRSLDQLRQMGVDMSAICVDAACSGNPGVLEYQGVTMDGKPLFRRGPFPEGTVNLGEFLAIVSALAMLQAKGDSRRIYTDSKTAMAWVRNKQTKSKLVRNEVNADLLDRVAKAVTWLQENNYSNPITKWETDRWGEIPADFGRKG